RQLVETKADLTGVTTWNQSGGVWLFDGAIVSVGQDPIPENNGIYFLASASTYTDINSWVKAGTGEGGGTITGGTNGLSTSGTNIVLGGPLTGDTTIEGNETSSLDFGTFVNHNFIFLSSCAVNIKNASGSTVNSHYIAGNQTYNIFGHVAYCDGDGKENQIQVIGGSGTTGGITITTCQGAYMKYGEDVTGFGYATADPRWIPDAAWVTGNTGTGNVNWDGSTANALGTYVDADTVCAEPNLVFNGSLLTVTGAVCASTCVKTAVLQQTTGAGAGCVLISNAGGCGVWTTPSAGVTNLGYSTAITTGTVTSDTGTNATIPAATTSLAGLMVCADKVKLDGIANGAQVNVATDLSTSYATTTVTINSTTGTNATINAATASLAGVVTNGTQTFAGTKITSLWCGSTWVKAPTLCGTTDVRAAFVCSTGNAVIDATMTAVSVCGSTLVRGATFCATTLASAL
ncbi:unnamed protein product, partial [marine sediment metagenome]